MAGGLRDRDCYREDCRRAGLNTVEEELEEADMVRTFRILNGDDDVQKERRSRDKEQAGAGSRRRRLGEQ